MKALNILAPKNTSIGLNDVITYLSTRKICITRHSSSLLQHELNLPNGKFVLQPGTQPAFTSLQNLIIALNDNKQMSIQSIPPDNESIEYTPPPTGDELKIRGDNYALFRATKNKLYAGKQSGPLAVFGTFLFDEADRKTNEYGDVTFTFPPNTFHKCVFTLGDRLKGYTNISDFVRACFFAYDNVSSKQPDEYTKFLKDETLIPKGTIRRDDVNSQIIYPCKALLASMLHIDSLSNTVMEYLTSFEIQIFDPVDLSKEGVTVIYRTLSKLPVATHLKKEVLEQLKTQRIQSKAYQKTVREQLPTSISEEE